jgi:hypothetical protein
VPDAPDAPGGGGDAWTDAAAVPRTFFGRVGVDLFVATAATAADLDASRELIVGPLREAVRQELSCRPEKARYDNLSTQAAAVSERLGRAEADLRRLKAELAWRVEEAGDGVAAELVRLEAAVALAEGTRKQAAAEQDVMRPLLREAMHKACDVTRTLAARGGEGAVARVQAALDDALAEARAGLPAALGGLLDKVAMLFATVQSAGDLDFEVLCLDLAAARPRPPAAEAEAGAEGGGQ